MAIFAEVTENECINEGHLLSEAIPLLHSNWKTVRDRMYVSITH